MTDDRSVAPPDGRDATGDPPPASSPGSLPVGKLPVALLGRLLAAPRPSDPAVLVGPGIGRDAAAIAIGDRILVAKNDPITFVTDGAADYLVDVNANDLACLGAEPRWLLVTALFRDGTGTEEVEAHFAELTAACDRRGIALVGGHSEVMAGLDRTVLVGTLLGETDEARLIVPGRASVGDRLLVTKGIALEGTALLARELAAHLTQRLGADLVARAANLLADPGISVLPEARLAAASGGTTALHDPTENGLATAVREMAMASGCGARLSVSAIPVLPETEAVAAALGLDPLGMLASGSLLVAARPDATVAIVDAWRAAGIAGAVIGKLVPAAAGFALVDDVGRERPLPEFATDEVSGALVACDRYGQEVQPRAPRQ